MTISNVNEAVVPHWNSYTVGRSVNWYNHLEKMVVSPITQQFYFQVCTQDKCLHLFIKMPVEDVMPYEIHSIASEEFCPKYLTQIYLSF